MAANEAEIARSDPEFDFFIFCPLPCSKELVHPTLPLMRRYGQHGRNFRSFSVIPVSLLQRSIKAGADAEFCGLMQSALCGDSLARYRGGDG